MAGSDGAPRRRVPLAAQIGVVVALVAVAVVWVLPMLGRPNSGGPRPTCQNFLKTHGIVFKMYSSEKRGQWPPLAETPGLLSFRLSDVEPEYMSEFERLLCPNAHSAEERTALLARVRAGETDVNYIYLGYAVLSDAEAMVFSEVYREHLAAGGHFDADLPAPAGRGTAGGDRFLRLHSRLPESLGLPASEIPVMFDRAPHHKADGLNVLFMDGHVRFVPLGSRFPATEPTLAAIARMEAAGRLSHE